MGYYILKLRSLLDSFPLFYPWFTAFLFLRLAVANIKRRVIFQFQDRRSIEIRCEGHHSCGIFAQHSHAQSSNLKEEWKMYILFSHLNISTLHGRNVVFLKNKHSTKEMIDVNFIGENDLLFYIALYYSWQFCEITQILNYFHMSFL